MFLGTFASDLLLSLPESLRTYYDLDRLAVADYNGVLVWLIRAGATWYYGEVIGEAFTDAVVSGWSYFQPSEVWA